MCVSCLRQESHSSGDIIDDIPPLTEIIQCKKCNRWHNRLNQWIGHELESSGLMNFCLKRIHVLSTNKDIKVLDCVWVWTEPHSRRLKCAIDVERGVSDDKVKLRQRVIIEFVVVMGHCVDCAREETEHTWGAMIQIRQSVGYKRSLMYLENLIVKNGLSDLIINVEARKEGLDLYFANKGHAERVAEFIGSNIPSKAKTSKKLVSHNTHTNTARQEITICIGRCVLIVSVKHPDNNIEVTLIILQQ